MKVEEMLSRYLESLGMSSLQTSFVLTNTKIELGNDIRMNDDISGYSDPILYMWKEWTKQIGLDWIKKCKPMAWFRPMFER